MIRYPVYIPSKGRPGESRTIPLLNESSIPFHVVVEPQDYAAYSKAYPHESLLKLPINDGGISYARSFCKKHSTEAGDKRHWQFDDDIQKLYTYEMGQKISTAADAVLYNCESFVDRYNNIAIAGLMNTAFGFNLTKPFKKNQCAYGCVLVLNDTDLSWRMRTTGEDTDYSLQALSQGWCTIVFQVYQFLTPSTGTNKGGNSDAYIEDKRMERIRELQRFWGKQLIRIHNRYGRPQQDLSRVWRKFDTPLVKVADAC